MSGTGLAVGGLCLSYGGVQAVRDLSFEIAAGEAVALMGPNGAGKTSVLDLLSRVTDADDGRIRLGEHELTRMPRHRLARHGLVRTFQNITLFGSASVADNLLIGRHVHLRADLVGQLFAWRRARHAEVEARAVVDALLSTFGLQALRDRPADALSYGQRKIVELARAVAAEPRCLLLDEPTAGLGPAEASAMITALRALRARSGLMLLIAEHDPTTVRAIADRVLFLEQGRCVGEAAAARLDVPA